ncbi:putative transcription factor MYB-HB-like family [Medicago truncatula]|uniref:Putative transcription factor MYB-HB-like family n=1 Tax=Medicago truncatula TaxID=3880 RepID=A0A396GW50_MEDTR|nr:putative transcription factor MYB-HB-like family [Medicago truncatula]
MELDPGCAEKIPCLHWNFPKDLCVKPEIPKVIPSQPCSTLSPPPSHYTTYLYQNHRNQFKEHALNRSNNQSSFPTMIPSSRHPISGISMASYNDAHNNGSQREFLSTQNPMIFTPNNNKIEAMHGCLNTREGIWDLSKKNIFRYGETSQPRVSPDLSPSLVYDAHPSVSIKPKLQGDIFFYGGFGNEPQENNGPVLTSQRLQKRIQNNIEIQHKDLNIIKGQWTTDEDRILIQLVDRFGLRNWSKIAKYMNGRIGKQCRERWNNHLCLDIKEAWTEEEDKILVEAHKIVGNKWAEISRRLSGRTENSVKNHWNATKRCLKAKKKNRGNSSKGTLLLKYIMEVTCAKKVEKEMMTNSLSMMNIGNQPNYESSESDFFSEGLTTPEDEIGGYVPMMFNDDDGMASGFGSNGMEFFPEIPKKQEIDLMEKIYRNP